MNSPNALKSNINTEFKPEMYMSNGLCTRIDAMLFWAPALLSPFGTYDLSMGTPFFAATPHAGAQATLFGVSASTGGAAFWGQNVNSLSSLYSPY